MLLEETIETITDGLGVDIGHINGFGAGGERCIAAPGLAASKFTFRPRAKMCMVETVDGAADTRYVANWILTRLGVRLAPIDIEVEV